MCRNNTSRQRFHWKLGHTGRDGLSDERHAECDEDADDESVGVNQRMIPESWQPYGKACAVS